MPLTIFALDWANGGLRGKIQEISLDELESGFK